MAYPQSSHEPKSTQTAARAEGRDRVNAAIQACPELQDLKIQSFYPSAKWRH